MSLKSAYFESLLTAKKYRLKTLAKFQSHHLEWFHLKLQ